MQTHIKRYSTGNLLLSTALLFSENTFQCIKEMMMDIAKVRFFSKSKFLNKISGWTVGTLHNILRYIAHQTILMQK